MHDREEVRLILEKLYQELSQELGGIESSQLVDEMLDEKNKTIEDLRKALVEQRSAFEKRRVALEEVRTNLLAKTEELKKLKQQYKRLSRSFPVRLLRKVGIIT